MLIAINTNCGFIGVDIFSRAILYCVYFIILCSMLYGILPYSLGRITGLACPSVRSSLSHLKTKRHIKTTIGTIVLRVRSMLTGVPKVRVGVKAAQMWADGRTLCRNWADMFFLLHKFYDDSLSVFMLECSYVRCISVLIWSLFLTAFGSINDADDDDDDDDDDDSADEDSGSAGSFDELGPRGRPRPLMDHRWRSLDRRTTTTTTTSSTTSNWDSRRRSADRLLDSPDTSRRIASRLRSVDPRTSPDSRVPSTGAPTTQPPVSEPFPQTSGTAGDVSRRTDAGGDAGKTTEDLTLDIDSALAEVMSEIESLGLSRVVFSADSAVKSDEIAPPSPSAYHKQQTSSVYSRQDFEDAPDLVIGLPTGSTGPQSSPKNLTAMQQETASSQRHSSSDSLDSVSSGGSSVAGMTSPARSLTAAEVFANADQCTIKKAAAVAGPPVQPTPSCTRPTPACRARSVDAAAVLTVTDSGATTQRSSSPPARRPCGPVPKAKPARRSDVSLMSKPYVPTPADIRPDVEFVRAIVPPFAGDTHAAARRTFTLPRDTDVSRGRPDTSRCEVGRSMSVGDATAAVDSAALRQPQPASDRDPSPAAKPPVKVKPPVMKKPARAGEVIKRLTESLAQQSNVSVSAPQ